MKSESSSSLEAFIRDIPHSRMIYPRSFRDRLKYLFWKVYTPCHPFVRDTTLGLRIFRHEGRQNFILGRVAPDHQSLKEFISFLIGKGFKNHFVAWKDSGELVSLRYMEDFAFQYHIRIFKDGEVRGHYEYTPEYRPLSHILEIGMEDRRHEFHRFLGDRIVKDQLEYSRFREAV